MKLPAASKQFQIDKTQSTLLLIVGIATVVTVFCLMSSKALLSQGAYQRRLINERQAAVKQLEENTKAATSLIAYYNEVFNGGQTNVLGGKNDPSPEAQPPNGTNGRVVLNALPTQYDFPALVTSVTKMMSDNGFRDTLPQGVDESGEVDSSPSAEPAPQSISLTITGSGNLAGATTLVRDLERSIRPFDVTALEIRGTQNQMFLSISLNTYFQPATVLSNEEKEVR